MTHPPSNVPARFRVQVAVLAGALIVPIGNSGAVPVGPDDLLRPGGAPPAPGTSDSAPSDKPPGEIVRERAPALVDAMKADVGIGQLERIGLAAPVLLRWQPENAEVRALHALFLAASDRPDEAREALEAARKCSPAALPDLCAEALLLLRANDPQAAEVVCRKAIALDGTHAYPWNVLGRIALAEGEPEEAAEHFARAIALNAGFQPAHLNLGVVSMGLPDPAPAVVHFREALRLSPRDSRAAYGLAAALEARGEAAAALEVLEQSVRVPRPFGPALEMAGRLQLSEGQYEAAAETGARMRAEKIPDAHVFLAGVHLRAGHPRKALETLETAPVDDGRAGLLRANCALAQKDYPKALALLDRLLEGNPEHYGGLVTRAAVRLALGEAGALPSGDLDRWGEAPARLLQFLRGAERGFQGDWKAALDALRAADGVIEGFSAAGLEPDVLPGALQPAEMPSLALGLLLHLQGLRGAAKDRYAEALRLHPESVLGNYLMAALLLGHSEGDEAARHLERSLTRAPEFFPSLYALGDLAMRARQAGRATEYLRRAQAVVPTPAIELKLGVICENTHRPDEAEAHYRRYIESSPTVYIGYNQLAWLYASQGKNLDEALALAEKANALQPGNASILDTLGWIHFKEARLSDALRFLTEALAIAGDSPLIHYHLGAAYGAAGNRGAGRKFLEEALQLDPDFPEAGEVKRLLGTLE